MLYLSYHTSVRLRVARSTQMGIATASRSGTSNRYRLSRSFYIFSNANEEGLVASFIIMCKNLQKIIFRLMDYEFHPDATTSERIDLEELCKERHDYFLKWVEEVDTSKEIPFIKSMALVEDSESGGLHEIEAYKMRFIAD